MAVKKVAKKTVKKAPAKKRAVKKPKLVCTVCGMALTVDRICGCAEVHQLICCGRPMQAR